MARVAEPKKPKGPTPYDGFDLVRFIDKIRRENLEARNKEKPEPRPRNKPFIPLEWQEKGKRWFQVTEVSKCLRWTGYKVLGEKGTPLTFEDERKMEKGIQDHYRLEREFGLIALAKEITIFDPENGVYGRCDLLARNYITGELFVVDFKTIDDWLFRTRLKRAGLPEHLKGTRFYPAIPDDEFQVMLYIRMWRQLIRHPEIPIRFGLVIYENKNNPNQRKCCLVEYDEKLMEGFFSSLQKLNAALDRNKNIPPYIPKEAYVHRLCPFNLKCPRGQEALALEQKKKKNIPLWKIYELKKRVKQPVSEIPKGPQQGTLFNS